VVDDHQFIAAMPVAMLMQSTAVDERRLGDDDRGASAAADYLEKAAASDFGIPVLFSPIVLSSDRLLDVVGLETGTGTRALVLPFDLQLEILDGVYQVGTLHEAIRRDAKLRALHIPVVIHHGQDRAQVQRAFAIVNRAATPVTATLEFDPREIDPLTNVALYVEDHVPLLQHRVGHEQRQLGAKDQALMTLSALRTACTTFAFGIRGVQRSFNPTRDYSLHDREHLRSQASGWFGAVIGAFSDQFEPINRGTSVLPSPAAMAAIGAFGHPLLQLQDSTEDIERRITRLCEIDWSRGPHWSGIAGKLSPKGRFSTAGGTKENAYAIFRALDEPSSREYRLVRHLTPNPDVSPVQLG